MPLKVFPQKKLLTEETKEFASHKNELLFKDANKHLEQLDILQLEDYERESLRKVKAFGNYLSYVVNTSKKKRERDLAKKLALELFLDEDVTINDSTLLYYIYSDTISLFFIEDYLKLLLDNQNLALQVNWDCIKSMEDFNGPHNMKKVEIRQKVNDNGYFEKYKSKKMINTYFTYEEKYIYNNPTRLFQIKLGNVSFKKS